MLHWCIYLQHMCQTFKGNGVSVLKHSLRRHATLMTWHWFQLSAEVSRILTDVGKMDKRLLGHDDDISGFRQVMSHSQTFSILLVRGCCWANRPEGEKRSSSKSTKGTTENTYQTGVLVQLQLKQKNGKNVIFKTK